jgi:hypothetical protein
MNPGRGSLPKSSMRATLLPKPARTALGIIGFAKRASPI